MSTLSRYAKRKYYEKGVISIKRWGIALAAFALFFAGGFFFFDLYDKSELQFADTPHTVDASADMLVFAKKGGSSFVVSDESEIRKALEQCEKVSYHISCCLSEAEYSIDVVKGGVISETLKYQYTPKKWGIFDRSGQYYNKGFEASLKSLIDKYQPSDEMFRYSFSIPSDYGDEKVKSMMEEEDIVCFEKNTVHPPYISLSYSGKYSDLSEEDKALVQSSWAIGKYEGDDVFKVPLEAMTVDGLAPEKVAYFAYANKNEVSYTRFCRLFGISFTEEQAQKYKSLFGGDFCYSASEYSVVNILLSEPLTPEKISRYKELYNMAPIPAYLQTYSK